MTAESRSSNVELFLVFGIIYPRRIVAINDIALTVTCNFTKMRLDVGSKLFLICRAVDSKLGVNNKQSFNVRLGKL